MVNASQQLVDWSATGGKLDVVGDARPYAGGLGRPEPHGGRAHHRHPRRLMAARLVTVTVREGAVVYHDGRAYGAGAQIKLPAAEARSLLEQGVVDSGGDGR
jgi:hypothetical protein